MDQNSTRFPARMASRFGSGEYYDAPVLETAHFSAIPTLGSLVDGWLLLIPKAHVSALADLPEDLKGEFENALRLVKTMVQARFGEAVLFEHGARSSGSLTGCGVDHAHMHIVPLDARKFQPELIGTDLHWDRVDELPTRLSTECREYLWFQAGDRTAVAFPGAPTSQYFRRVVAQLVGKPEEWNYRDFPHHQSVRSTLAAFGGAGKRAA